MSKLYTRCIVYIYIWFLSVFIIISIGFFFQENNPHTKKELKIEPNTNCQEKLNISVNVNVNENPDIDKKCSLKHDENTSHNTESLKLLEVDKSTMLKSTVKNSTQSLDKQDLCTIKKEKVEVEKKIITSTTLNGNIKDNDIQKVIISIVIIF